MKKPKLKLLISYEIPFTDGRVVTGDEYHGASALTERELERIRLAILVREQASHGAVLAGPCILRAVLPLIS